MESRQVDMAAAMLHEEFLPVTGDYIAPLTPETLHRLVTDRVAYLLENDFNRLMSSLYLIDVPEHAVQSAFAQFRHVEIPAELATLIIDREMRKAQTRAEHRFT